MVTVALMKKFVLVMQLRLVGAELSFFKTRPETECDTLFGMQPATPDATGKLPGDTESNTGKKISELWKGTLLCAKQLVEEGRSLQKAQKLGTWRNTEYARDLTKVDYTLDYLSSNELLNSFVVAHRLQKKSYLRTLAQTVAWEKHMQPYAKIEIPEYSEETFKYERGKDGQAPHIALVDNALAVGTNADHDVKKFIDDTRKQILANSYTDKWSENFQPMWGKWEATRPHEKWEGGYEKNSEKWKHVVEALKEQGIKEHAELTGEYNERAAAIDRAYPKRRGSSETPRPGVAAIEDASPNPNCINLDEDPPDFGAKVRALETINGIGPSIAKALVKLGQNGDFKASKINWEDTATDFAAKFEGVIPQSPGSQNLGEPLRRPFRQDPGTPLKTTLNDNKAKFVQGGCK